MTGFPGFSRSFRNLTVDELWAMLEKEINEKSILTAGTQGNKTYTNGLVGGHAYALLGIYKLSNGVRLVKLANPWGVDAFNGDWSDNSSKWTPALRKEVASVVNEQDGVFFQTVEQLKADWWGFSFSKNTTTWKKT